MSQIEKNITSYCMNNYGNLVLSDPPSPNPDETEWTSILKSRYPRFIINENEDPPSRELYFISLENLGSIHVDKGGKVIKSTPREIVVKRIKDYLTVWNGKVENAIMKACSSTLVFSPIIKYYLNPLRRIVATLLLTGRISNQEIKWLPNVERGYQWILLLKTAHMVEEYENGFKYGDMWAEFYNKANAILNDPEDEYNIIFKDNLTSLNRNSVFEHLIMSYMLEENFSYIQDVMNLTQMNTVINFNNAFYKPCLESRKLLSLKPNTVLNYYNRTYPKQKLVTASSAIMDLVSIGLLHLREGKLHGNEDRFEKMLELNPSAQLSLPF